MNAMEKGESRMAHDHSPVRVTNFILPYRPEQRSQSAVLSTLRKKMNIKTEMNISSIKVE